MAKLDLKNLPKAAKIIIAILPALLIIGLSIYFVILPRQEQIKTLDAQIAKQEADIAKAQSMVQRLDTLKEENKKIRARLKELEAFLPEEKEISSLLKQVEDLVHEARLDLLAWKPAAKRTHSSGIVFEVPVSASLNGSYHRLGIFLSSLTKLDRIVNVSNISMTGPSPVGNEAMLKLSFSAVTFTAKETTE